jgi:hypothetical protein
MVGFALLLRAPAVWPTRRRRCCFVMLAPVPVLSRALSIAAVGPLNYDRLCMARRE